MVLDGDDRPFASFLWPGNTADVTRLMPVVQRLRERFGIAQVCSVADRGMISAANRPRRHDRSPMPPSASRCHPSSRRSRPRPNQPDRVVLKRPMARKPLMHNYIYFETLEVGLDMDQCEFC